jgi:hypothetical protein
LELAAGPGFCLQELRMLHPEFPVIEGKYQLTDDWSLALPEKFNRRLEGEDLVLWRPGFTIWIAVWDTDNTSPAERLKRIREDISSNAFEFENEKDQQTLRFSYRLIEEREDNVVQALYCFAIGKNGHMQMAIYFDDESDLRLAKMIWRSVREH